MKITDLPNPGKYVAWVKRVRYAFSRVPENQELRVEWDRWMTKAQFEAWCWDALMARINSRGAETCHCETCADPSLMMRYRRDQQRLREIQNRVRVYQFETAEVNRRFSHLLSSRNEM